MEISKNTKISKNTNYEERRLLHLHEINHSKYMVLIQLLCGTFLLLSILLVVIVIATQTSFAMRYISSFGKLFIFFMLTINAISWATWAMSLSPTIKSAWKKSVSMSMQSRRFRDIESYEEALYVLHRQKNIEKVIGLLTAMEFILLTIFLTYIFIYL